jgi:hypothetical protein
MQYAAQEKKPEFTRASDLKKKKKLTREDFKKDLSDAVKAGMKGKGKRKTGKRGGKGFYEGMSVAELRSLLNQKKNAVLSKAGFPDGKLPRSKVAMIALCKKLKRKRW